PHWLTGLENRRHGADRGRAFAFRQSARFSKSAGTARAGLAAPMRSAAPRSWRTAAVFGLRRSELAGRTARLKTHPVGGRSPVAPIRVPNAELAIRVIDVPLDDAASAIEARAGCASFLWVQNPACGQGFSPS